MIIMSNFKKKAIKIRSMQKQEEILKQASIGGSLETALSGKYALNSLQVIKNAVVLTNKNFVSFFPAVVILFLVQGIIGWVSLKLQIGEPLLLIKVLTGNAPLTDDLFMATQIANLTSEIVSIPLYAAVYLMAISNSVGIKTTIKILVKGFYFTLPLTVTIISMSIIENLGGYFFVVLGLYISLIFSFSIPLVCEKRLSPFKAMLFSAKAVNKKFFPLVQIYLVMFILFLLSLMTMGLGLIWVMPFFFHIKAVLYRDIFGVQVVVSQVFAKEEGAQNNQDDNDDDNSSNTFDA